MDDDRDDELLGDEDLDPFEQDGPDLFGAADPDELEVLDPFDDGEQVASDPVIDGPAMPDAPSFSTRRAAPVIERPEAPLALYRRYRPDTFADLIGQDHVTEPLQRALVNNRVNHAYLFSGPRGCGKTTSARILARALNCAQGPAPVPCGECRSCRDLARGGPGSIDVIEIDAASHGGVNEARDLRERAFFAPVQSRFKIYIIDEAHMVTKEGFNALLKVVEEPPPHVKFIFATTEPEKVLGTIRSRTHHYPFRLVPPRTLTAYLGSLCEAEGIEVEPAVLPLVVRAGAGSVRDSLSVLDQLLGSAAEAGVSYRQATGLLGFTPDALLDEIVDAFAAGDAKGVFAAVDRVIEVGQDPRRFAEDLLRRLRDLIIIAAVPDALSSGLVDVAVDQAERLSAQASLLGAGELTRAAEVLAAGLTDMRGTTAPRLHLELMCARVLLPGADVNDRGIHARLDRLERRLAIPSASGSGEPVTPAHPEAAAVGTGETSPGAGRRRPAGESPAVRPAEVPRAAARPSDGPGGQASGRAEGPTSQGQGQPSGGPGRQGAPAPAEPAAPVSLVGEVSTADLRRLWPDVLDEVKTRRRFTWILLSQNAHVVEVRNGVLTLGISNAGARDSFGRGGSEEVLREAILERAGVALKIEVLVDLSDQPTETTPAAPAPTASHQPVPRPAAAAVARENIRPTRGAPSANRPDEEVEEASRLDPSVEEAGTSHDELLAMHLGAELIGEEE